jgi:hypothetical protein
MLENQKILCIATRTPNIEIDNEVETIRDIMQANNSRFEFESRYVIKVDQVSDAIMNNKTRPQIIHFCGEGTESGGIKLFDDENKKEDELKPEDIAEYFSNAKDVKYIILNFCYSEKAAKLIAQYVQCVIGIKDLIGETEAVKFSRTFYKTLEGNDLDQSGVNEAFSRGQAAAFQRTEDKDKYIKHLLLKPQPEMQIIEPVEGSTVPLECVCKGTFKNLDEGASMWAYLNATKEGKFYLVSINNYPTHSTDGEWQVTLPIADDDDDYRIGVLIVDPEKTPIFKEEHEKAIKNKKEEDQYFALDSLPTSGTQVFGDRAVKTQYRVSQFSEVQ